MDLSNPVSRSNFNFRLARFWSSPEFVPGITIIAHVLKNPAKEDIYQVVDFFGMASIRRVMSLLESRNEISDRARKRSEEYIEMYKSDQSKVI